jgi:hypothetical protein
MPAYEQIDREGQAQAPSLIGQGRTQTLLDHAERSYIDWIKRQVHFDHKVVSTHSDAVFRARPLMGKPGYGAGSQPQAHRNCAGDGREREALMDKSA